MPEAFRARACDLETTEIRQRRPEVSVIGQGTWYIDHGDRNGAVAALRRGIDLGMTHIDTAEMYGDAELVIADAIAGRRDEVFLVSKVLPSNASRRGTITACERSLKRLKTDRLDCYLLHWRGSYPLAETVAAFEQLVAAGKIRSWGVSNFDVDDLDELLAVAGEGRIACNQVLYHLQERAIEHAVIPWCEQHGVAVVAYSPFGHDDFPSPRSKPGEVLQAIADAHGASPRQVALGFLTRDPAVFAIPKASSAAHAADNAAAGDLVLDRRRDRGARQGVSARAETAQPADAVSVARAFLTGCCQRRAAATRSRISAACFRTLSMPSRLSFFDRSPDSIISAPEFRRDPASRRSRQAGQCRLARCPRRSRPRAPRRRAPTGRSAASR